jgi:hypothetical protein
MKWIALVAVFAVALIGGLFTFAMWSRAAGEVASFREWGVCIDAPAPGYSIEASMPVDFYLVDLRNSDGHAMRVYIGNHPQLDQSAIDAGRAAQGALTPVPGRENHFVAVEPTSGNIILHMMLSASADRERLLAGVRFCGNDAS